MYKLQLLMFMFSYYRNMLPSPLCSLFIRNCDILEHYTRCRNDPRAVARNSHIMNKSFICNGNELWGALPQNTKERKSIYSFKRQIKNMYINAYSNWIRFLSWSYHNILVYGPDRPPVHPPPPQERVRPILFCSWDLSEHEKWMPPSPNWDFQNGHHRN